MWEMGSCQGLRRGSNQQPSTIWGVWGWMGRLKWFSECKRDYIWSNTGRYLDTGLKGWNETPGNCIEGLVLSSPGELHCIGLKGWQSQDSWEPGKAVCVAVPFSWLHLTWQVSHIWRIHSRSPLNRPMSETSHASGARSHTWASLETDSPSGAALAPWAGASASCWKMAWLCAAYTWTDKGLNARCSREDGTFAGLERLTETSWGLCCWRGPQCWTKGWDPLWAWQARHGARAPQTQLHLKAWKSVGFGRTAVSCCGQDGGCPINSMGGLHQVLSVPLAARQHFTKPLFSQKHTLSAHFQPCTL